MTSKGVYVHVTKVPGNASFWKLYPGPGKAGLD